MTIFTNPLWLRRGAQVLALASLFMYQACSDDDDKTLNTTAPEIAFSNITDGQTLRNTVKASLTATDAKGIQKIDLYVDGTLLTSLATEPFETSWNTSAVKDGQHTVKAVATGTNGTTAEKSVTVSVSNVLVTLNIAAGQLASGGDISERGFLFLSDADGKLLASAEYKNNDKVELTSAGFDGDTFFLTEVLVTSETGEDDELSMSTFAGIERGKEWKISTNWNEDIPDPVLGDATLNFVNIANGAQYDIYSISPYRKGGYTFANEYNTSNTIQLRTAPSPLYVVREEPLLYNLFPAVTVASTTTLDLSKVNKPMTSVTVNKPTFEGSIAFGIDAFPVANDYTAGISITEVHSSAGNGNTFEYAYPGNAFPSYVTSLEVHNNEFTLYRQSNGLVYNPEKLEGAANFTFSNGKLTVSSTGTKVDAVAIPFEDNTTLWYYILPQGQNQTIPSLEIPPLLNSWSFPGLDQPISYQLYDFDNLSAYADVVTYLRGTKYGFNRLFDEGKGYTEMEYRTDDAGRTSKASRQNVLAMHHVK